MPRLQSLLLWALSAWPGLACASPKHAVDYECGTLESGGGEFRYSDSSGLQWSLSVVDTDVLLVVDGAEARFLDGAPSGKLAWGHRVAPEPEAWYLQLPCGVTRWKGHEIECRACRYLLKDGADTALTGMAVWCRPRGARASPSDPTRDPDRAATGGARARCRARGSALCHGRARRAAGGRGPAARGSAGSGELAERDQVRAARVGDPGLSVGQRLVRQALPGPAELALAAVVEAQREEVDRARAPAALGVGLAAALGHDRGAHEQRLGARSRGARGSR